MKGFKGDKTVQFTSALYERQLKALREQGTMTNRSISYLIRDAVEKYIKRGFK